MVKIEMVNPHAWFHVAVKNPDGTTTEWMIEGGSPNALIRHGFTKNSIPIGTEVIFEGYQAKDGSHRANGRDITFPGGKKIFLGSSGSGRPAARCEVATRMEGVIPCVQLNSTTTAHSDRRRSRAVARSVPP